MKLPIHLVNKDNYDDDDETLSNVPPGLFHTEELGLKLSFL